MIVGGHAIWLLNEGVWFACWGIPECNNRPPTPQATASGCCDELEDQREVIFNEFIQLVRPENLTS
jgi:hypothetical protein